MKITCKEMKAMDSHAINTIKIPSIVLMERASLEVINNIDLIDNDIFTIICGVGNNGGDGLAICRHLLLKDKDVRLFILGDLSKATKDFNINLDILKNLNTDFINIEDSQDLEKLKSSLKESHMVIDSIFGIGLKGEIEGLHLRAIEIINKYSKYILSIDIPSGLDGDTGRPLGLSVIPKKTISFHLLKNGLYNNHRLTGKVIVVDIGIPEQSTKANIKKI